MPKTDTDRPARGRRLSWTEFSRLTGRQPANDNLPDHLPLEPPLSRHRFSNAAPAINTKG